MGALRRNLLTIVAAVAVIGLVVWAYWPAAVAVETAAVAEGRFEASISEDGRTRVRDRYVVSAPLAGRLLRVRVRAGDAVEAGAVVATILPLLPAMLDARSRQEAEQRLGAGEAALAEALALVERARAQRGQAEADARRTRTLGERGVASVQQRERDELALRTADRDLRAAELRQHAAEHDLDQARALLRRYDEPQPSEQWEVTAPIAGRVLRVVQESAATLAAGAPLVEIGDVGDLEVIADLLTTDAVRVAPGARVASENWGGPEALEGRVRLVEPGGFTKLSALGVEEQRVWVVIDIAAPHERWAALGDGFRVDVRITVETIERATLVPAGAVFRHGDGWSVFVVADGRATRRAIELRARSGALAAVARGLAPGERVVVFPPSALADGARVRER